MNRTDPPIHDTAAESSRRDAWEELLLRSALQARAAVETGADERWQRLSSRIAAYEHIASVHEAMSIRGAELRRILALSRPWPSLQPLFS